MSFFLYISVKDQVIKTGVFKGRNRNRNNNRKQTLNPQDEVNQIMAKTADENRYFNLVASIAALYDCNVLDINFQNRIINLHGSPQAVQACSTELEKALGPYHAE